MPRSNWRFCVKRSYLHCAQFLAIKVFQKFADDSFSVYPKASKILKGEMYVDDILSGGHSLAEAKELILLLAYTYWIPIIATEGQILSKVATLRPRRLIATRNNTSKNFTSRAMAWRVGLRLHREADLSMKMDPVSQRPSVYGKY